MILLPFSVLYSWSNSKLFSRHLGICGNPVSLPPFKTGLLPPRADPCNVTWSSCFCFPAYWLMFQWLGQGLFLKSWLPSKARCLKTGDGIPVVKERHTTRAQRHTFYHYLKCSRIKHWHWKIAMAEINSRQTWYNCYMKFPLNIHGGWLHLVRHLSVLAYHENLTSFFTRHWIF